MNEITSINFNQFKLEKHVEEALVTSRLLSNNNPLSSGIIIRSVLVLSDHVRSDAFKKISELFSNERFDTMPPREKIDPLLDEVKVEPGLYQSFQVAKEFWLLEKRDVWGRDLITLALLAKDPSLTELAEKTGTDINEIRNQWFSFVTSASSPYPKKIWEKWWKEAGFEMPDMEKSAYLLLWNPELYKKEDLRKTINRVLDHGDLVIGWSTGNRKNVEIGEKVYLMRQGSDNPGIVGCGSIVGEITEQPHFDPSRRESGDTYNRVPVRWERLQVEPIIPLEVLERELEESSLWHSQGGGIEIKKTLADKLNNVWEEYLRKAFIKLKIKIYSDKTTNEQEDLLGYKNYSTAISEIIKNNANGEPFNIGVIAPWGHGKTTLMEYIREDLEPQEKKEKTKNNEDKTSFKELKKWLSGKIETQFTFSPLVEYHPTIWFNAWKYQSSDQIWAGIGHAIITQLVGKLKIKDQEKFWFKLQSDKLDKELLQRKLFRYIYQNLPLAMVSALLTVAVLAGGIFLVGLSDKIPGIIGSIFGVAPAFWSFRNFKEIYSKINSSVHGNFAQTLKVPDYSENLGIFHRLTQDLQNVFNLLIDAEKPAVVFIDDLDRCSPEVVADVMEAINLIMTNPLVGKHCYFVFGMDAQIVAATLDKKYEDLKDKLPGKEHTYGSVGWYFLDKFIQVPFIIPIMQSDEKKHFLENFFVSPENPAQEDSLKKEGDPGQTEIKENIELKEAMGKKDEKKISHILKSETNKKKKKDLERTFISERIKQYKEDSEEIIEQLEYLLDYLSSSPREIKRYVNLLTLHNVHQNLRFYQSHEVPKNKEIAKWLLISLKWPQLIRWMQWENEKEFVSKNSPEAKAKKIDSLVADFMAPNMFMDKENLEFYKQWLEYLKNENVLTETSNKDWLKDKQLFQVLISGDGLDGGLEKAIRCRVW